MKKKYVAPDLYFESFRLSQSIAAGCTPDGIAAVGSFNQIGYFLDDRATMTCTEIVTKDNISTLFGESYCYWSGTDMKLFTS